MIHVDLYFMNVWQIGFLSICTIICIEILFRSNLKSLFKESYSLWIKVYKVLKLPNISDNRKESLMILLSKRLLINNMLFLTKMLFAFIPLFIGAWIVSYPEYSAIHILNSPSIVLFVTTISVLYLLLRIR